MGGDLLFLPSVAIDDEDTAARGLMAIVLTEVPQIRESVGHQALHVAERAAKNRYGSRGLMAFSVGLKTPCLLEWSEPLIIGFKIGKRLPG